MDWIQLVLTPVLTGVVVYFVQLYWQERMERRLTRFSKLHERRAEVIAGLYELLVDIQSGLRSHTHAVKSSPQQDLNEEELSATEQSIEAFRGYFEKHRIYLPESLAGKIQEFHRHSTQAEIQIKLADICRMGAPGDLFDEEGYSESVEKLARLADERIPSLKQDIEEEFRKLLGS
jgi:hypothetical protein